VQRFYAVARLSKILQIATVYFLSNLAKKCLAHSNSCITVLPVSIYLSRQNHEDSIPPLFRNAIYKDNQWWLGMQQHQH
jgi:hypothetical protein